MGIQMHIIVKHKNPKTLYSVFKCLTSKPIHTSFMGRHSTAFNGTLSLIKIVHLIFGSNYFHVTLIQVRNDKGY